MSAIHEPSAEAITLPLAVTLAVVAVRGCLSHHRVPPGEPAEAEPIEVEADHSG